MGESKRTNMLRGPDVDDDLALHEDLEGLLIGGDVEVAGQEPEAVLGEDGDERNRGKGKRR